MLARNSLVQNDKGECSPQSSGYKLSWEQFKYMARSPSASIQGNIFMARCCVVTRALIQLAKVVAQAIAPHSEGDRADKDQAVVLHPWVRVADLAFHAANIRICEPQCGERP